jgi:hypothetical protein
LNLIGNDIRHGADDVAIAVSIDARSPDAVAIEVEHGGTLPESLRENPSPSPVETGGGAGLTSTNQSGSRAHGGGMVAEASGGRTVFTVRLPRRAGEP